MSGRPGVTTAPARRRQRSLRISEGRHDSMKSHRPYHPMLFPLDDYRIESEPIGFVP